MVLDELLLEPVEPVLAPLVESVPEPLAVPELEPLGLVVELDEPLTSPLALPDPLTLPDPVALPDPVPEPLALPPPPPAQAASASATAAAMSPFGSLSVMMPPSALENRDRPARRPNGHRARFESFRR